MQTIAMTQAENGGAVIGTRSISISRWLTNESAALMVVYAVYAFATSQLFVTRNRIAFLLICIAVTGAIQASMGIYQTLADPTATVWGIKSFLGGSPFGSFVNRSNAAVMLNVGLAASLGLIAWRMAAITGASLNGEEFPASEMLDVIFDRTALIGIVCSLLCVSGMLISGSRGGLVGSIGGLLLAFGVVQSLHRSKGLVPTLLAVGVMAAILLVKFELPATSIERLQDTPGTVLTDDGIRDSRLDHWKDAFRAAKAQPLIGWGLGTYRYAYLPFQQSSSGAWFVNADNLWLECFVETGVVGIVVLFVLLGLIVHSLRKLNASVDPIDHGIATAGWFLLGSLGVSQFFDFGLSIPANSLVTSILLSAVVARTAVIGSLGFASGQSADQWRSARPTPDSFWGAWLKFPGSHASLFAFGLTLGLTLFLSIKTLDGHARGDHLTRLAWHLPRSVQFNEGVAKDLHDSLTSHVSNHPDDSRAMIGLARLVIDLAKFDASKNTSIQFGTEDWIANYQSLSPSVLRSVWYSGAEAGSKNDEIAELFDAATATAEKSDYVPSGTLLPYRAENATLQTLTESQPSDAEPMSVSAQRLAYGTALHQARNLAVSALLASPRSDEAHIAVISLDFAGGSTEQSAKLIESLVILRSQHGQSLVKAGRLASQARLWQLAASAWTQALTIEPALTSSVLATFPGESPVSIASILPNNVKVLSIAAQQEIAKNKPDIAILTRASDLLEKSQPPDRETRLQQLQLISRIHAKRGQTKLAAESLAKAVVISPGDVELRYQYAMSLRAAGEITEAREQSRAGRRIAPSDPRFEQLLTAMGRLVDGPNE